MEGQNLAWLMLNSTRQDIDMRLLYYGFHLRSFFLESRGSP